MALTDRERLIVSVANALTIYSIRRSESSIQPDMTPHQFVLDTLSKQMSGLLTAKIVDDVFAALLDPDGRTADA